MTGCQTCGGYGNKHDLAAHIDSGEDVRVTYAEEVDDLRQQLERAHGLVRKLTREAWDAEALLHQTRSIANEYRSGSHWTSQGMERIAALLDEAP